jgi:UDP-N-acetylmuramate: L-alanyl-gamma-D-glutamyl-meso-diaminopimelate ligase
VEINNVALNNSSVALINKEWFSPEKTSLLSSVPAGGIIHIIGICGIAMAQLALSLSKQGYVVSGTDSMFYDPMGSLLKASSIKLHTVYAAENVPENADLVVIANAMFPDNPEVTIIREKNLPYSSFPMVMGEWLIGERHSIVVCGTHGKTTTTGITASILHNMGESPSWFIGGLSASLPETLHKGEGEFSVIEGDEYHCAFYAKKPKFFFYRPNTVIINAIEFDHGDIYKDVEAISAEFKELLLSLKSSDRAICCIDYPEVRKLLDEVKNEVSCKIFTFGFSSEEADFYISERKQSGNRQVVLLSGKSISDSVSIDIPMIGRYNALNAVASYGALLLNGFSEESILDGLAEIQGVSRRQQILFQNDDYILMEDFAHHPTAVKGTVSAVSEAYPEKRMWAVFEPRSNTSRRKVFEDDYKKAFEGASMVLISDVTSNSRMNADSSLIDVNELAKSINSDNIYARALPDSESIYECITSEIMRGDIIVIMSNGAFGNICKRLKDFLEA